MMTTQEILDARESTHGNFEDNSETAQDIKDIMRRAPNWKKLHPFQKECLEMIAHKIGRALHGDHGFIDHWADIAGYATKTAEILERR